MCESYVHAYSNPCCSASFISSIIRWYGGSGRTVTPKLSIDPPQVGGRGTSIPPRKRIEQWPGPYVLFALAAGAALPVQLGSTRSFLVGWTVRCGPRSCRSSPARSSSPWPRRSSSSPCPPGAGSVTHRGGSGLAAHSAPSTLSRLLLPPRGLEPQPSSP